MKFLKPKTLPIGLDIGASAVKLAQMRDDADGIMLVAAGMMEAPPQTRGDLDARMDFVTRACVEITKSNAFRGRQCVMSLPAEAIHVQHLRLPKLTEQEIEHTLQFELAGKLPWSAEESVYRHIVAGDVPGDGENKQEVIVFATARSLLDSYLKAARRAKLDVVGINTECCAIVECFSRVFRRTSDTGRTILYVDMGVSSTQAVLSHGEHIVFARNIMSGGDVLDKAVATGLQITPQQAHALRCDLLKSQKKTSTEDELYHLLDQPLASIADELTQCLRYYESVFRNQSVERVIFVGGQAYDKRFCQSLAQRLNLPAQIGDPLLRVNRVDGAGLGIGLDRREPQPNWAVAVGLSLGANRAA